MNDTPPDEITSILVVDDSDVKRFATASAIRAGGFKVLEATNGRDGLWMATSEVPSLIVLDVNLPDIHGFEVVSKLKERAVTAAIPVVHLSTTRIETIDRTRGLDGGADAYLVGSVEPAELLATIRALLRAKRSEERANYLATQWQTTFDAITDGVCVVDTLGIARQCNVALAQLLDVPIEGVVGQNLDELMLATWKIDAALHEKSAPTKVRRAGEMQGESQWFAQTIDPILDVDGVFTGAVRIIRDITQRKREIEELTEAKRLADDASRTKSNFLANMSHEIRSPLAAMLGYRELLDDETLSASERKDFLQMIARNGNQLVSDRPSPSPARRLLSVG